jgi:hypothetical protein
MADTVKIIKEAVAAAQSMHPVKKISGVSVDKPTYRKMRNFVFKHMENPEGPTHDELKTKFEKKYPNHKKLYGHFVDTYDSGKDPFEK